MSTMPLGMPLLRRARRAPSQGLRPVTIMALLGLILFWQPCAFAEDQVGSTKNEQTLPASLIQLLASPEKYHGKRVQVEGFLHYIRYEEIESALYLSREDANYGITANSLGVSYDEYFSIGAMTQEDEPRGKRSKDLTQVNGKYVLLEGVFDKEFPNYPSMGAHSGGLRGVNRILILKKHHND